MVGVGARDNGRAACHHERVTAHIRIVALLHIALNAAQVLGALLVIGLYLIGAAALGFSTAGEGHPGGAVLALVFGLGVVVGLVLLLPSLPGFLGGVGLLALRPWARWVVVIVSVIYLFAPPFHTAIGIYSLWALLNQNAELVFRAGGLPRARV